ncbi:hypothetical protein GCM10023168_13100 [Fodinibacter luteus]|uniref:Uncharacterized protein n=1 Tax=Fodinibacter luteus TaxID=552064 RepID=A0ABP8K9G8_9MICO
MNTYADQLFLRAEIDRRLELFGLADARHPSHRPAARRRRLFHLARRVRRVLRPAPAGIPAPGRPRHP